MSGFEPSGIKMGVSRTPWQEFRHHFKRNRPAVAGTVIVIMLAFCAISSVLATSGLFGDAFNPQATNTLAQFVSPLGTGEAATGETKRFLLGSDDLGRDVLSLLWAGSTVSLLVGFLSVGISVVIGIMVGGIAGFYGRGKATLPFILTVILPPVAVLFGTFRFMGDWAGIVELLLLVVAAACFVLIVVGAISHRAWRALITFGVMAVVGSLFFVVPRLIERQGESGAALIAAREASKAVQDATDAIRDAIPLTTSYDELGLRLDQSAQQVALEGIQANAPPEARIAGGDALVRWERAARAQADVKSKVAKVIALEAYTAIAVNESKLADTKRRLEEAEASKKAAANDEERDSFEGAISRLSREAEALEKAAPDLKKKYEEAKSLAESVATLEVVAAADLLNVDGLRLARSELGKYPGGFRTTIRNAIDQTAGRNALYKLSRNLPLLILVGFFLILAYFILAKAGQDGARNSPALSPFFIPVITIDNLVMRAVEVLMTIPTLILLLTILAFYEKDVWLVMFVIGITSWMGTARFVRAEILSLRERDFIQAGRALGISDVGIITRHLVPNALSPVLVSATIGVASAIILESTLSFLGLGAGPGQVTWGKMLADSRQFLTKAPWMFIFPSVAILIVVLAFNLLGEGMREAMNPKLRKR